MKKTTIVVLCLCTIVLMAVKCEDDDDPNFCSFNYGKVKFTPGTTDEDQIVEPQFDGDEPKDGTYSAEPEGLDIDENTGAINIDNSEPGEYTITFVSQGRKHKTTTCETSIYIEEPEVEPTECVFKYEKEVYVPQETSGRQEDQVVAPIFEDGTVIDGTFTVEPTGLDIDPKTGIFGVNSSVSGGEYTVTYTSKDGYTTCKTSVVISGIDYLDAIVDVTTPETSVVTPVVDAQPDIPAPQGFYDVDGSATQQNLVINRETGAIDLRATLQQINEQEFVGAIIPDGFSRKYTIKYTFTSNDVQLISSLEVVIYWYLDEIPEELLALLENKQQFPQNGRTLRPPPLLVGKGQYN